MNNLCIILSTPSTLHCRAQVAPEQVQQQHEGIHGNLNLSAEEYDNRGVLSSKQLQLQQILGFY